MQCDLGFEQHEAAALHRCRPARVLASMVDGDLPGGGRAVVLAVDHTKEAGKVLQWCADMCKQGDVVHVVHVAKVLGPSEEVFHGVVGTSLNFRRISLAEAKGSLEKTKHWLETTIMTELDRKGLKYVPHLFVDDLNAPAASIAQVILHVASEVDATCIVAAKSNKTWLEKTCCGSVAAGLTGASCSLVLVV